MLLWSLPYCFSNASGRRHLLRAAVNMQSDLVALRRAELPSPTATTSATGSLSRHSEIELACAGIKNNSLHVTKLTDQWYDRSVQIYAESLPSPASLAPTHSPRPEPVRSSRCTSLTDTSCSCMIEPSLQTLRCHVLSISLSSSPDWPLGLTVPFIPNIPTGRKIACPRGEYVAEPHPCMEKLL